MRRHRFGIFLWKLTFSLSLLSFLFDYRALLLLYCCTIARKNCRLKKKITGKYFSRQFRILDNFHLHPALLYPQRDERYGNPLFPLGPPNFLSFVSLFRRAGDRILERRAVVYFSLRGRRNCLFRERERNGGTCEFRANKEGLFSRDFTEATPRNTLLFRGSLRI